MEKCNHQFFKTHKVQYGSVFDNEPIKLGANVVCALCGEVRRVWRNGKIDVIKKEEK